MKLKELTLKKVRELEVEEAMAILNVYYYMTVNDFGDSPSPIWSLGHEVIEMLKKGVKQT